ncbi:MAG: hypothetical protein KF746_17445 [Chitinophagaceae bacterium]|nr:hypothetical protein [Chitinophagaceae bacterium]
MKVKYCLIYILLTQPLFSISQSQLNIVDSLKLEFDEAFRRLTINLKSKQSFEEAVFATEQLFNDNGLSSTKFNEAINFLSEFGLSYLDHQKIIKYNQPDSINYLKNYSIFSLFFDTSVVKSMNQSNAGNIKVSFSFLPEDPLAKQDWTNMFVSKLLQTGKGNCHSLAYLYKIIADKIGAKCWLALAPNHIYIKNFSQYFGWYNTELTSRSFPTDAWIMTTSYIHPNAVRSGLYMDTLSNQQSIALCVLDLAKGYEAQTHNYNDGFIIQCCDLVLQYHPVNPMALLLKAETLRKVYALQNKEKKPEAVETYRKMEAAYIRLAKLYYREMPEKMYLQWLKTAGNYNNTKLQ